MAYAKEAAKDAFFTELPVDQFLPEEEALRMALIGVLHWKPGVFPLIEWIDKRLGGEIRTSFDDSGLAEISFLPTEGQGAAEGTAPADPEELDDAAEDADPEDFFASLPDDAFSQDEESLRAAILDFLACRALASLPASMDDIESDGRTVACARRLLPPSLPLRDWIDRRVGGEAALKRDSKSWIPTTVGGTKTSAPSGGTKAPKFPPEPALPLPPQRVALPLPLPPGKAGKSGSKLNHLGKEAFFASLSEDALSTEEAALRAAILKWLNLWPLRQGNQGKSMRLSECCRDTEVHRARKALLPGSVMLRDWISARIGGEVELRKHHQGWDEIALAGQMPPAKMMPPPATPKKGAKPPPARPAPAAEAAPPAKKAKKELRLIAALLEDAPAGGDAVLAGKDSAAAAEAAADATEAFFAGLPADELTEHELKLRSAVLNYLELNATESTAPLFSEASKDAAIKEARSAFLTPDVTFRMWMERRIGGEAEIVKDSSSGWYLLRPKGSSAVSAGKAKEVASSKDDRADRGSVPPPGGVGSWRSNNKQTSAAIETFFDKLPTDKYTTGEEELRDALLTFLENWKEPELPMLAKACQDSAVRTGRNKVLPKGTPVMLRDWIERRMGEEIEVASDATGQVRFGYRSEAEPAEGEELAEGGEASDETKGKQKTDDFKKEKQRKRDGWSMKDRDTLTDEDISAIVSFIHSKGSRVPESIIGAHFQVGHAKLRFPGAPWAISAADKNGQRQVSLIKGRKVKVPPAPPAPRSQPEAEEQKGDEQKDATKVLSSFATLRQAERQAEEQGGDEQRDDEQKDGKSQKKVFAATHATGFWDFLLKPELLRAIADCGFEHPSEVQHECVTQAIMASDLLCAAQSGMGKTAVLVLACLQQVDTSEQAVKVLVLCHTRELGFQIRAEFDRLAKYLPDVSTAVVYGGVPIVKDTTMLRAPPHILIGTPGRVRALMREKYLKLDKLGQFVVDECDKCLHMKDTRKDIQQIFADTPKEKQVMMFGASMPADIRALCKTFMQNPHEIVRVDEVPPPTTPEASQQQPDAPEEEAAWEPAPEADASLESISAALSGEGEAHADPKISMSNKARKRMRALFSKFVKEKEGPTCSPAFWAQQLHKQGERKEQPCRKWAVGQCQFGVACRYSHDGPGWPAAHLLGAGGASSSSGPSEPGLVGSSHPPTHVVGGPQPPPHPPPPHLHAEAAAAGLAAQEEGGGLSRKLPSGSFKDKVARAQAADDAKKSKKTRQKDSMKVKGKKQGSDGLYRRTLDGRNICFAWNNELEGCKGGCGMVHACRSCLGNHPMFRHKPGASPGQAGASSKALRTQADE